MCVWNFFFFFHYLLLLVDQVVILTAFATITPLSIISFVLIACVRMTWLYRDTTRRGNSIDRAQDWGFLWANIVLDIGKQGNWGSLIGRVPFVVRCLVGILGLFICFIRWSFFCY